MASRNPADIALRDALEDEETPFEAALTEFMTTHADSHVKEVTEVRVIAAGMVDAGAAALAAALQKFPKLRFLAIGDNSGLTAAGAAQLIGVLSSLTTLEVLFIRDSGTIGTIGAVGIASAVPTSLQELIFQGGEIGNDGMIAIAGALPRLVNLQGLSLRNNFFDTAGAMALANALGECQVTLVPKFRSLSVSENPIGDAGVAAIVAQLGNYPLLQNLNFSSTEFGDAGTHAIAGLLTSGKLAHLEALGLGLNPIHDDGAFALAEAIPTVKSLRHVDVHGCAFTEGDGRGYAAVHRVLPQNQWEREADAAIKEVSASHPAAHSPLEKAANNAIRHALAGVDDFEYAIRHFMEDRPAMAAQVTELTVYDSTMDDDGAIALSEALPMLPKLNRLCIGSNQLLGLEGIGALISCLPTLVSLESLIIIDGEKIGAEGMVAIASVLPSLPKLRELVIVGGGLGAGGAAALAEALPAIPKLEILKLACNDFTEAGMATLGAAFGAILPKLRSFTFRA